jgi:hypothetical protein
MIDPPRARQWVRVGLVCLAVLVAQGCREEEQGRVLLFEKGSYLGQPDEKLKAQDEETLRQRAASQKF